MRFYVLKLRNRKHVPCFYRVIETRVEVWDNGKCCGNTSRRQVFPQLFHVLPNFHECFYDSIVFLNNFLLYNLTFTRTDQIFPHTHLPRKSTWNSLEIEPNKLKTYGKSRPISLDAVPQPLKKSTREGRGGE